MVPRDSQGDWFGVGNACRRIYINAAVRRRLSDCDVPSDAAKWYNTHQMNERVEYPNAVMCERGYDVMDRVAEIAWSGYNVADATSREYTWTDYYGLSGVSVDGAAIAEYAYDVLGNLVAVANGEETFEILVDGGHSLADVTSDGTPLRVYMRGPGVDNGLGFVDVTGASPVPYYYVTDHLGSVLAVVDAAGNVVERYEYDAWGKVLSVTDANGEPLARSAIGNRILWQGREYSWTTGLYYFRNRWYDPTVGRWISKDPIGNEGGINLYEFCESSPLNFLDGFGEDVYVPDNSKHGKSHVVRYHGSQNVGRYNKDGSGILHKGKMPPKNPKSEYPKFLKAAAKLKCLGPLFYMPEIVDGVMSELDRFKRARENGRTYKEQLGKDIDEAEYIDTPWGPMINPEHKGPFPI